MHYPGLGRRQAQAKRGEHTGDLFAQVLDVGFMAMHEYDEVVRVADDSPGRQALLPTCVTPIGRPHRFAGQPRLHDVLVEHSQGDVGQKGRAHAPNAMGNFCFEVTLGYRRLELLPRAEGKGRHNG